MIFLWLIVGSFVAIVALAIILVIPLMQQGLSYDLLQQELERQVTIFLTTPSIASYVITNIPFLFWGLGIFLGVKWLHDRPFRTLISADRSIRWRRLFAGFGVWGLIIVITVVLDYALDSPNYKWVFNPSQWLLLVPFALILTPIQTSVEEFFFRGYLLQGLGLLTRQRFVLILINAVLFMLPHLANPEMQRGPVLALHYFAFGVFLVLLTLKDDRLELALGVHAANNLQILFFNTRDSALPAPSIWQIQDTGDPAIGLVFFILQCAVFYSVFFGRRKPKVLTQDPSNRIGSE